MGSATLQPRTTGSPLPLAREQLSDPSKSRLLTAQEASLFKQQGYLSVRMLTEAAR
jgi:hypothetical protein